MTDALKKKNSSVVSGTAFFIGFKDEHEQRSIIHYNNTIMYAL